jgi:hypothetical protein
LGCSSGDNNAYYTAIPSTLPMRKIFSLACSLLSLITLSIGLFSCKDDEPYIKPNLSVKTENLTVSEDAGIIGVELVLDRPASAAITIAYTLGGTAVSPADYGIVGKDGEVVVSQGKANASIPIEIANDQQHEMDETIEISLTVTSSDNVGITSHNKITITISDNDLTSKVSFLNTDLTVSEAYHDDFFKLDLVLDKPATEEVEIKFQITHGDGYAIDELYADEVGYLPEDHDYFILGNENRLVFPPGSTSGQIQFNIWSDFKFEEDELIEITITEATGGVEIGENNIAKITLKQENGKIIKLVWEETYADVDMDLLLYYTEDISSPPDYYSRSSVRGPQPNHETLIVPEILLNGAVGLCYTYYSGTQTPMNFETHFIDFVDGQIATDFDVYSATYTLSNIYVWDDDGEPDVDPTFAQTFKVEGGEFKDITDPIFVPESGSRLATGMKDKIQKRSSINSKLKLR